MNNLGIYIMLVAILGCLIILFPSLYQNKRDLENAWMLSVGIIFCIGLGIFLFSLLD